jgi:hypothetical protein
MPAGFTETDSVAGAVPDVADNSNQFAETEAAHESVPPPVFVIERVCGAGAAPPTV